ncbi:Rhodanese-like protein [Martensiomyces pterosporus]|nr:Rhodanese-like protein [Martensiomyces pterosporus]
MLSLLRTQQQRLAPGLLFSARATGLTVAPLAPQHPHTATPKKHYSSKTHTMSESNKLVTAQWLNDNLDKVKVLDCSWYLPFLKRNAHEEFRNSHIPGAQYFDIDAIKDLSKADLPHMLPPPEFFGASMDRFGISNGDHVVVYDGDGVRSACRVFWTFNAMGHSKVSVLDGGFPKWTSLGYKTEAGEPKAARAAKRYVAQHVDSLVCGYESIVGNIEQLKVSGGAKGKQIIDARPNGRFTGKEPEFRPGLSSGHMPYSISVPFTEVTSASDSANPQVETLKSPSEIRQVFENAGVDLSRPIITSCGSGVTASVLYFALLNAGVDASNITLYDGSWTEYALNPYSEIIKD